MSQSATALAAEQTSPETSAFAHYLDMLALIERLHRLLLDTIKDEFERLERFDLNAVQALLLFNIGDKELSAGELKSRGHYQGSNVSYNLKKLVEGGFIHHERSDVDRRSVRVRLTEKGMEIHHLVATLFGNHSRELIEEPMKVTLEEMNANLRVVERFWADRIRYMY